MPRQKTIGEERRNTRLRIEHLRKRRERKGAEEQRVTEEEKERGRFGGG